MCKPHKHYDITYYEGGHVTHGFKTLVQIIIMLIKWARDPYANSVVISKRLD